MNDKYEDTHSSNSNVALNEKDLTDYYLRAPLYEALIQYDRSDQRSFHVPGHKDGKVYTEVLKKSSIEKENNNEEPPLDYFKDILKLDVTEITGTDDLHHPEGAIKQGQDLAARCFGAEETHWLVGGSTAGNLALILTTCCQPGDIILVQRNVHKSILNGLMLAGAQAVFLMPELEPQSGLAVIPSLSTIHAALNQYPAAKAVLLTSPNYYGMSTDLSRIADLCHEHELPLLIDEAHGAHYSRHHRFPSSALAAGADGVVQSTHKMLNAMTMGAMLHVQGPYIQRSLLKQRLTMIQSSSPSYPIMASLDISRYVLDRYGESIFEQALQARDKVVQELQKFSLFDWIRPASEVQIDKNTEASLMTSEKQTDIEANKYHSNNKEHSQDIYTAQDPFKLVIYEVSGYLSGSQLQEQLEQHGCVPEMCDDRFVVLAFGPGSTLQDADCLLAALQSISEQLLYEQKQTELPLIEQHKLCQNEETVVSTDSNTHSSISFSPQPVKAAEKHAVDQLLDPVYVSEPITFSLQPADESQVEQILLAQAADRIAAEMIIPYPPGIPIVYAGERIHADLLQQLLLIQQHRLKVQGAADSSLQYIKVYKQT